MSNIYLSNAQVNRIADSINGAAVGLGKVLGEKPYNADNYTKAMKKLTERVNEFLKAVNVKDKTKTSYVISEMISRAMRWSKGDVKVLSGSAFRKWFRDEIVTSRLEISMTPNTPKQPAKQPTKKLVSAGEFEQFKAWQAAQAKLAK